MTWGTPFAWLGAFALLVPLLVHFFTRRPGRLAPFPTLRFVPRSRLVPAWSPTPSDLWLMLVRMAVLLLATAALARPRLPIAPAPGGSIAARIVVVDSSWSMLQRGAGGMVPIDSAALLARTLADSADVARIVYTATPATELAGAVAWLNATNATTRELILVSDFQRGTIDSGAVARLASQVGFRAVRVPHVAATAQRIVSRIGDSLIVTDFALEPATTVVRYRLAVGPAELPSGIAIGNRDTTADARMLRLVADYGVVPFDTIGIATDVRSGADSNITVVLYLDDSNDRDSARASAAPFRSGPQAALVAALAADAELEAAVSATVGRQPAQDMDEPFVVIARNRAGDVIVDAASRASSGELMVFAHVPTLSSAAVSILGALEQSARIVTPVQERDTMVIGEDVLGQLAATPAVLDTAIDDTEVGRWVWVLVLIALAVEWYMRRTIQARAMPATSVEE